MKRILVIEDDPDIGEMIGINLRDEGYAVDIATHGAEGLERLKAQPYELVVLDLMLPGIDGLEICRQIRSGPSYQPIVIVSAKSAETHRILGLELGADDYLTKPFSVPELIARIRALFRRAEAMARQAQLKSGLIACGRLRIDPAGREATLDGEPLALTGKEFDLLLFFARHPGQVFSRRALLDQVWGYSHDGYEHTVNSHINRLRGKIERDPARPDLIQTVWGVGYKFVAREQEGPSA
ncbi:response regulator transcription factor [Candidatus Methylocalor cossyra]